MYTLKVIVRKGLYRISFNMVRVLFCFLPGFASGYRTVDFLNFQSADQKN